MSARPRVVASRAPVACCIAVLLAACFDGDATELTHGNAIDHGRALFSDPGASPSPSNAFSCATCHPNDSTPTVRIFPGASLAGAAARTSFWGGQRLDLLEAINDCRASFMDAPRPWTTDDEDARAMWAWLASIDDGDAAGVPFSVLVREADLPAGDSEQGRELYAVACWPCHGTIHDGAGRLATFIPKLPDDVNASHAMLVLADRRNVFLRKAREGAFRDGTGSMPPFSREALSDTALASVFAYLGQY
jgi:thiosulfate dehydrogenase